MDKLSTTSPSSAEVIQFPGKQGFAAASKAWLEVILAHPKLTPATKVFLAAIYGKFNTDHYHATGGELFAWPSRDTLVAATGLSIETINESIKQAEHWGVLHVEHGRRLGQRRAVNKYFARMPQGQNSGPWQGQPQGQNFRDSQGQKNRQDSVIKRIGESISGESISGECTQGQNFPSEELDSASRTPERALRPEEQTPEKAAARPEEGKPAKVLRASPQLEALIKASAKTNVARWRAVATNGSGDL